MEKNEKIEKKEKRTPKAICVYRGNALEKKETHDKEEDFSSFRRKRHDKNHNQIVAEFSGLGMGLSY